MATGAILNITEPLTTLTEIIYHCKYITNAINIPLIVDGDACFGDATMATRTVKEFIKAGVSAIHIEDQVIPKRAYYHKVKIKLIPVEEMLLKIKISCEVRDKENGDFVIIARTDAGRESGESFDKAIERANIYADSGADLLMTFPRNMEEIRRAPKEIKGDLVFVATQGLKRPIPNVDELKELGYKIVVYPFSSVIVMNNSIKEMYSNLMKNGHTGITPVVAERTLNEVLNLTPLPQLYNIEDMLEK